MISSRQVSGIQNASQNDVSQAGGRRISLARSAFAAVCIALGIVLTATHAAAQGCAMCYQNAAASGTSGQSALRHGILALLIPALAVVGAISLLIYRRRGSEL